MSHRGPSNAIELIDDYVVVVVVIVVLVVVVVFGLHFNSTFVTPRIFLFWRRRTSRHVNFTTSTFYFFLIIIISFRRRR